MLFFASLGLTLSIILVLVFYVLLVVADWKIFEKAGEAGWKSIIPIYNVYITFKISWTTNAFWIVLVSTILASVLSGMEGFWVYLAAVASVVSLVVLVLDYSKLSKAFGHGIGYTLGLLFLPNVFTLILGFGSDRYLGPQ